MPCGLGARAAACSELRLVRVWTQRDALERARALPQRHFSFHSWHQSAVREANRRLKEARSGKGAATANGGGGGGEEEEEEESEEMASLRARVEQQALKEAQAEEAEEAQRA